MTDRNIYDIIEEIIECIPKIREHGVFIMNLRKAQTSASFAAPELQIDMWHRTQTILEQEIGDPEEQWEWDVANIFNDTKGKGAS